MKKRWQIRRNNYVSTQGWMVIDLGLKGNELLVYAAIYGFSQTEGQWFTKNANYLADWTNTTKRTILNTLKSLTERGLLVRAETENDGIRRIRYRAVVPGEIFSPGAENDSPGDEIISPGVVKNFHQDTFRKNNIFYNISSNISPVPEEDFHKSPVETDVESTTARQIMDLYNAVCTSLPRAIRLTDKRRKRIRARLLEYTPEELRHAFELAQTSPFLRGDVNPNFHADIDWILKPDNLVKILEGKYKARNGQTGMTAEEEQTMHDYLSLVNRFKEDEQS